MKATLHADGGARGNPGPAGIGVVLKDEAGEVLAEVARGIGETTNNVAEYEAVIAGLELALARGVKVVDVNLDSELVVSQLKGEWKIKNDRLRGLAVRARALLNRFESASIRHVMRAQNADADRLANLGMDRQMVSGEGDVAQGSFPE
jgi:ribonuclease H / adenosylcobalamin/alpha-ribazole phosphatase